ncbi:MAG: hypothetical protein RO009_12965 [Pseudorhodoplanes sp.]|jgi:hypothetical protein|nr:hypothetical protein [Pseudorhodoplanes sp.]
MAKQRHHNTPRSSAKGKGPRRAAPTSDWLSFIRPHFDLYRTLPWGKQKEFIDRLAREEGQSANTLRRYIAAAEFLEGFGITRFPANIERLPVAAVEAIGRISRKDPARGRALLDDLLSGIGTIRGLKKQLAAMPRASTLSRKPLAARRVVSRTQLHADIESLVAVVPELRDCIPSELILVPFNDWVGPANVFSKQTLPRAFVPLLADHAAVVFDEAALVWAASPAMVIQAFLRNIAAATAMFDLVVVYCDALQSEVARVVATMRHDCRRRMLVKQGALDC